MLSVRNLVLGSLAILVLSLIINVITLSGPPDSNGAARDSYGTRRDGYRAVFELLESLRVPVERRIDPPDVRVLDQSTLVLWMPHEDLIANEPRYLEHLEPWLQQGGRLIVALPVAGRGGSLRERAFEGRSTHHRDILSVLKLPQVHPETVEPKSTRIPIRDFADDSPESLRALRREQLRRALHAGLYGAELRFQTVPVTTSGTLSRSKAPINEVQVPQGETGGLRLGDEAGEDGRVECQLPDGTSWVLAVSFPRGKGQIVVVAEPMVLMNASLAQADNAALAYDLLTGGGRRVVFDEFYHGLSVRGNPLWLLTRLTYATVTAALLLLMGLLIWREALLLGPPLPPKLQNRRTIVEYLEAMSRFFLRSRGHQGFVLQEIRTGLLRTLGERCNVPQAVNEPSALIDRMSKRSRVEATDLTEALDHVDRLLTARRTPSESETIRAVQRMTRCL